MQNLINALIVILVLGWAIGFIGYNLGGIFHILLVVAAIAVLIRIIQGKRPIG